MVMVVHNVTFRIRAAIFLFAPTHQLAGVQRQKGMTLIECLVSLALSSIVLAGTYHTLGIAFAGQAEAGIRYRLHADAQKSMRRISDAINLAERRKKQDLLVKSLFSTGDWLNRLDPVKNQSTIFRYDWSALNQALVETVGASQPVTILTNVTDFKVESLPTNSDVSLISVTLKVGTAPDQVTITETRRLGGAW